MWGQAQQDGGRPVRRPFDDPVPFAVAPGPFSAAPDPEDEGGTNDADEEVVGIRARDRPNFELLRQALTPLGFRGHGEDGEARRHMWT